MCASSEAIVVSSTHSIVSHAGKIGDTPRHSKCESSESKCQNCFPSYLLLITLGQKTEEANRNYKQNRNRN